MAHVAPDEIEFAVHSPHGGDDPHDTRVSASVFANKLSALVAALKAADVAVNGARRHHYTIAKLHTSTPTALLKERPTDDLAFPSKSGIRAFSDCATAIGDGRGDRALQFGDTASKVFGLTKGAGRRFSFIDLTVTDNVVRIDDFLKERAAGIVKPRGDLTTVQRLGTRWYTGVAHGSFVGFVKEVDLRGAFPAIKLVLSAGGKELDCVCRIGVNDIREALNRRVRVTGRAIYDGKSGLPRRVEVQDIAHLEAGGDMLRWKGAFSEIESGYWNDEGEV